MSSVTGFLARRLKLKVNETKSAVARPTARKFLGFSSAATRSPGGHRPKGTVALQGEDPGIDAEDPRDQFGTDDKRTRGLLKGLEELLQLLSDTHTATSSG